MPASISAPKVARARAELGLCLFLGLRSAIHAPCSFASIGPTATHEPHAVRRVPGSGSRAVVSEVTGLRQLLLVLVLRAQHGHEGLLGDLDRPHHLHLLLAFLLLLQELALAADVAAIALRRH